VTGGQYGQPAATHQVQGSFGGNTAQGAPSAPWQQSSYPRQITWSDNHALTAASYQRQGQNASTQPAGHQQQQGHGHGQAHIGECAPTLTSHSILTSISDRRAIRAASCNAAGTGQPRGQRGPKCSQCAGATILIPATAYMAQWQCVYSSQLPGTRQLVIDDYAELGCRSWSLWCKCISICQSTTRSDMDI